MAQPNFQETILNGLPKYELYKKLDNKDDTTNYDRYCKRVDYLESKYTGFRELCSMFARNLTKLNEILSDEDNNKERCRYFIFWIHDQIKKKLNGDWKNESNANNLLLKFYQVEEDIKRNSENNNCYYQYMTNTGLNSWIEWKYLYDYIKNYDEIKKKITEDNKLCQTYLEYLGSIEKIYEKFKSECCSSSSNKCPDPFEYNEWCADTFILSKFSCDKYQEFATDSNVYSTTPVAREQRGDESHSAASSLHENQHNTNGDGMSNNTDYYAKLGVSLPFVGILSTFVYLYNFTTFGTRIRSKLLRKSKTNLNLDDDAQHLLQHDSENIDLNTYNDDFNINYHSS